jgi:8-oxo-dGTP diphosphatase
VKLLKHIADRPLPKDRKVIKRVAYRAILFDEKNLTPILFVSKSGYHKIPGGGIEKGEDKMEALAREIHEETGCRAEIKGEVGKVTEYRSEFEWFQFQTSYCYFGRVIKKGVPHFDRGEMEEGFKLIWLTLNKAISTLKSDKPSNYEGKFIQKRDLSFLEEAKKLKLS